MSDKKFQRFGKYLILDHLVDGGMAKICRARYLGDQEQANKVVAIKMVQQQFSSDEAFVRMFQDELNITFGMLHPNIMQVYDYGKTNNQLYTAMEYIHGANLKQYLDRLKERKVVFPVEISCYIISQVCLGLHYAHTFTDKLTGKPYNIVHRDISPHNIMLTYDGAVKVIDFGIAKANTNSEATQAGTIKGKLSYLAPEYLDGLELDARYDEFAVGITLWELLCSRKLFQANNDLAVLKQIQACKVVPPSQINPSVPKELDSIVMKALSKDRANRYENLDQMNRALVRFLYSNYPEFNASDLKTFSDDLFKKEIETDRGNFVDYGKIDVSPYIEDLKKEESRTGRISKKEIAIQVKGADGTMSKKVREIELFVDKGAAAIDLETHRGGEEVNSATSTKRLSKTALQSPTKVQSKSSKTYATVSPIMKRAEKESTSGKLSKTESDKEAAASSRQFFAILIAISFTGFAYFQPEVVEKMIGINLKKMIHGSEPSRDISSVQKTKKENQTVREQVAENDAAEAAADAQSGELLFSGMDISMEVYINGQKTEFIGTPIKVELEKEVHISIKKNGFVPFVQKLTLTKGDKSKVIKVPELTRSKMGLLTTSLNYTAGSKLVYEEAGEKIERDLPFNNVQFPEGSYEAKIVNPILGTEKKVEFTIEENKKHFLE